MFVCKNCGYKSLQKLGSCPYCGQWGTFEEETSVGNAPAASVAKISEINLKNFSRISSGIKEVDDVFGGGLVPASTVLIAGPPGVGKSTLLLQMGEGFEKKLPGKVLYITGEENPSQVKIRASRISAGNSLYIASTQEWDSARALIEKMKPEIVMVDSIQSMKISGRGSSVASVALLKEVAFEIVDIAKKNGISFVITGHITKEGILQGPKIIEHMVDVVFYLEDSAAFGLKILYSTKNRYGDISSFALFQHQSDGLKAVEPQFAFRDGKKPLYGWTVFAAFQGGKTFLTEIQALVNKTSFQFPRRQFTGIDSSRGWLILAILERFASVRLGTSDVFINVAGGIKLSDVACDLAVAFSMISSYKKVSFPDVVFIGELGLSGEIRKVLHLEARLEEAARAGFKKAVVPALSIEKKFGKMEILEAETLTEAISVLKSEE